MKDKVKKAITRRLLPKYGLRFRQDVPWAWDQIKALGKITDEAQKTEIIEALASTKVIQDYLRNLARNEADTLLADDKLGLTELERIL